MATPERAVNGTGTFLFWKETAIGLAAIIFAVGGSWFAFGRDAVSQAEVRNLIAQTSPYALDRAQIQTLLAQDAQLISSLQTKDEDLEAEVIVLRERVAAIEAKERKTP